MCSSAYRCVRFHQVLALHVRLVPAHHRWAAPDSRLRCWPRRLHVPHLGLRPRHPRLRRENKTTHTQMWTQVQLWFWHFFWHIIATSSWSNYQSTRWKPPPGGYWQLSHMPWPVFEPGQWWETASSRCQCLRPQGHLGRSNPGTKMIIIMLMMTIVQYTLD